ncbi:MAG: GDSL-type esterase/lipase family protein [Alphaproteobacteria bacterium]
MKILFNALFLLLVFLCDQVQAGNAMSPAYASSALSPAASGQSRASQSYTIGALGDSMSAQSIYFPPDYADTTTQTWTASTTYGALEQVKYNNEYFVTFPAGGTSGATPPAPGATNDGGINWVWLSRTAVKQGNNYLFWAEIFNSRLRWDMSEGYAGPWFGVRKIIVRNGGSNYSPSDTPNFSNGGKGTLQVTNGVITGVTVTSPGYATSGVNLTSLTTSTGSGAQFTTVKSAGGTLAIPGGTTTDVVATLDEACASTTDIFVVLAGTNDVAAGTAYSVIRDNLKTIYERLGRCGKKVIAMPIPPRGFGTTAITTAIMKRVNRYIRAFATGEPWANTSGLKNITLADPSGFMTDGTSTSFNNVIGGTGGVAGAMTLDGVHQSERGAMYMGYAVAIAAERFVGPPADYAAREYGQFDGYDPDRNPAGNMVEGLPWAVNSAYALGALVSNGGNVFYCVQAGTSAGSGGPTGTGSNIVDNTVRWTYSGWPKGMSVMASSSTALAIQGGTPAGITPSGNMPSGYTFGRQSGSATGTITSSIESPWSNGQTGQRWVLTFSLGSGTNGEIWYIKLPFKNLANWGILSGDLGTAYVEMEAEIEISGVANVNYLNVYGPSGSRFYSSFGPGTGGAGHAIMNSAGEMMPIPIGGKMRIMSQPMLLPVTETTLSGTINIGFDASGAANSATVTVKINYIGMRRAKQARLESSNDNFAALSHDLMRQAA